MGQRIVISGAGWYGRGLAHMLGASVVYHASRHERRRLTDAPVADLLVEATGDVLAGAEACLWAFARGMDVITANIELDATLGPVLARYAQDAHVQYGFGGGDQPGCIVQLTDEVRRYGLVPVSAGMTKSFLDTNQSPALVMQHVNINITPLMACSFADGTKAAYEMASVCNVYGYRPLIYKPCLSRISEAIYLRDGVAATIMLPGDAGVFVLAMSDDPYVVECCQWLKVPHNGNRFLFYRPYHLTFLEARDCRIIGTPKQYCACVLAHTKRAISIGRVCDTAGGYDVYGVETERDDAYLPAGLVEYATPSVEIGPGQMIPVDAVKLANNVATRLWKEMIE